ncbi:sodium/hydrogen exchanger 3-like isoform X2 [Lycium barbarum]|uniref:sodium/hydrogen exchanger 3-like isoform X2 n=1 Tax=Lycium barbarum TaxID=112863 RepID=UPI00293ECACA|nr:sodium/hydrogen exchanger 3-like isoform X2 [Lycium barbarum]
MVLDALVRLGALSGSDDQVFVDLTLFVALLCGCIVIGHLLEESQWTNESITALIIGLCTGGIILLTTNGKSSRLLEFDEQLFFIYVIPPIIFNAGFQVKKKHFFRNLGTIVLFGVLGTLISFGIIAFGTPCFFSTLIHGLKLSDYLAIGAIFSATDSVCTLQVLNQDETPLLYSLVFGEGVVNDATSVVLFNAIQKFDLSNINSRVALSFTSNFLYLFSASTVLGVLVGLLSAYIIKKIYDGKNSTDREVALMILMAYLSYVIAELFDLSGILTVFLCGIVMSHYTWHNVTDDSKVTTRHAFATMSFIAETFIFLYVGMDALDIEKWRFVSHNTPGKSVAVSSVVLALVMVGRACFVIPLSMLSNWWTSKHDKIGCKHMVTIWWAGLMRGAVSMALAYNQFTRSGQKHLIGNAVMITSTIAIVLFSTMVFGLLTKPLIRYLLPPSQHFNSMSSSEFSFMLPLLNGIEDDEGDVPRIRSLTLLLKRPAQAIMYFWTKFDDAFMRRVFGGRDSMPDTPVLSNEGSDRDSEFESCLNICLE